MPICKGLILARRFSPEPTHFSDDREREYWHMAQNIAFRAGVSLIERDGCSWLISDDNERMICENKKRLWFETWMVMRDEYSQFQSW